MVRYTILLGAIMVGMASHAQNTPWPASGPVGIGTTTPQPNYMLHINGPAVGEPAGELLFRCTVSDSQQEHVSISNVATITDGVFYPMIWGGDERTNPANGTRHGGLYLRGSVANDQNDPGSLSPVLVFNGALNYNPLTGVTNPVVNRPLFSWTNQFTTHMLMSANGNLGLGTGSVSAPTARLHTNGTLRFQGLPNTAHPEALVVDANGNVARRAWPVPGGTSLTCTTSNLVPKVTGTNTLGCSQIFDNGTSVGIGTTGSFAYTTAGAALLIPGGYVAPATFKLYVNGVARASAYVALSDERFKKDIKPLEDAMGKLKRLNGVSYNWRVDEHKDRYFDSGHQIGFIAQELAKVVPEAVVVDEQGYHSVNYDMLIPLLTEAVKGQQSILDDKQSQIDELTVRLEELEATMKGEGKRGSVTPSFDKAQLFQNAPNPFDENTTIRYTLPENCGKCMIEVLDVNGKVVTSFNNLGVGNGQVLISAGSMAAGSYTYTLIVNGERSDSKTMVITR